MRKNIGKSGNIFRCQNVYIYMDKNSVPKQITRRNGMKKFAVIALAAVMLLSVLAGDRKSVV